MKKLFEKDEVWFAVLWIVIYVVTFSNADAISEAIGIPKLVTVAAGLVLAVILRGFIRRQGLQDYLGLCPMKCSRRDCLYFLPLVLISSVNLWNGVTWNLAPAETILYMISMCFVAFLEEVIFRGLLFRGMCRDRETVAIVVSSLTFGVGHIVNLLLGEPFFETMLQLVYAAAIGFCYTAVFLKSGSLLPCILSHGIVNATSVFAVSGSPGQKLLTAAVQTILGIGYGLILLRHRAREKR